MVPSPVFVKAIKQFSDVDARIRNPLSQDQPRHRQRTAHRTRGSVSSRVEQVLDIRRTRPAHLQDA